MGAGVLALYAAKVGAKCKFDSCVGIGCHYDFEQSMIEIKSNTFGLYDSIIAKGFHVYGVEYYKQFDELAAKKYPERVVGDAAAKITLASQIYKIQAKACGRNNEQYLKDVNGTPILHLIKVPFFFFSTRDDPFFGSRVIPIGHCHDNILLGVLKHGGHCCNIEGGILPTGQWWTKPSMVFMDHFMREAL